MRASTTTTLRILRRLTSLSRHPTQTISCAQLPLPSFFRKMSSSPPPLRPNDARHYPPPPARNPSLHPTPLHIHQIRQPLPRRHRRLLGRQIHLGQNRRPPRMLQLPLRHRPLSLLRRAPPRRPLQPLPRPQPILPRPPKHRPRQQSLPHRRLHPRACR
ncbi:Omega-amidase nit3 [Podospora pseudocomata]|uniref:Omega-amidase nit3 n=1 Tax=Podospora pseudocomata TaxID=2093779 RepID=A0ABR0GN99_9PEZI|nr:Omega-amidase nit3 [Podospora pseudocomata]